MQIEEALAEIARATVVGKKAISAPEVLNEAFAYAKPSSFSRGLRLDLGDIVVLLISGTASIDENGNSVHEGDFRAQMRRTFKNITGLLAAEGATWKDVVRTTCYLRDIERDYTAFNEERTDLLRGPGTGSPARLDGHPGHPVPARIACGNRSHGGIPQVQRPGIAPPACDKQVYSKQLSLLLPETLRPPRASPSSVWRTISSSPPSH